MAKAKSIIFGLLASASATAATVDLTLPPGDYYLIPVQPYTVVTIQSQPIDPPVLDTDGDGVNDDIDQCPDTPLDDEVDATGCTVVQPPVDTDGDGVPDDVDACPSEPAQTTDGCPVVVPPDPTDPPTVVSGNTVNDCIAQLTGGGFCEIDVDAYEVFRSDSEMSFGERGVTGPRSTWMAWNGAAINYPKMWFHGGGHNNSGMIDIYEFNWETGELSRIYTPPPFNVAVAKDNNGTLTYAARHDSSLPESTHTYDGFNYDPQTGLLLLITGYPYTYGFREDRSTLPDGLVDTTERGHGIYAFNPTDAPIKGVQPYEWKRVGYFAPIQTYPSMTIAADHYVVSNVNNLWKAGWVGDEFVVDESTQRRAAQAYPPIMKEFNGNVYRRNNKYLRIYTAELGYVGEYANSGLFLTHGYTLELHGDDVIYWDGYRTVYTQSPDGEWRMFDYSGGTPATHSEFVYSKWFKHPGYDDIYLGWSLAEEKPVVYRHAGLGEPMASIDYATPTLQQQVNASDDVLISPGHYESGPKIEGSKIVDFQNVEIDKPHNNGFVTVDGGPHVIRNLTISHDGRSGVWGQYGANFVLDGFDIQRQQFGVITSDATDYVEMRNGEIRDGTSCDSYGKCHNVYVGTGTPELVVDNVKSLRHHGGGHLLKSGAVINKISNSVFDGGDSNHSRIFDFYCAERVEIKNSVMIQSPNSDNDDLISVAIGTRCPPSVQPVLILENTEWHASAKARRFMSTHFDAIVKCVGVNVFEGVESPCAEL